MKKFTIRDWRTGEIIREGEAEDFKEFLEMNKYSLKDSDLEDSDLVGVNLQGADLRNAKLRGSNLRNANLRNAKLSGANLWGVCLENADFEGANLCEANLRVVDLRDANLRDANLEGTTFYGANLGGADFLGANFKNSTIPINNKRIFAIKLPNSNIEGQNINEIKIVIGCKIKTIKEWDTWFASDEEYETKRGTFEFRQIEATYEAYKAYVVKLWS